jgi:hypothetical protein
VGPKASLDDLGMRKFLTVPEHKLQPLSFPAYSQSLYRLCYPNSCNTKINEYGAFRGMKIDKGNRSTLRKPAAMPLCQPHVAHDLTWDQIQVIVVGGCQPTTLSMELPLNILIHKIHILMCQSVHSSIHSPIL